MNSSKQISVDSRWPRDTLVDISLRLKQTDIYSDSVHREMIVLKYSRSGSVTICIRMAHTLQTLGSKFKSVPGWREKKYEHGRRVFIILAHMGRC